MCRKFFFLSFFIFFELFIGQLTAVPLRVDVKADAAILMNANTGAILYEKNSRVPHYPASTTKIATTVYALHIQGNKLDEVITAQQEAIGSVTEEQKRKANYTLPAYLLEVGASHIGIKRGENLTFKDLLYGTLLASGNDAPNVIAQHIGGTIPNFMNDLNLYLQEIGCEQTNFCSPHGLHHPKHVTTAHDLAVMTKEGLKNPIFKEIISTVRYTRPKTNKQDATTLVQTNRLLRKGPFYYPKAIGVKTGYGTPALNTFVSAAIDKDRTLIAVLLHCKDRDDIFKDSIKLFDAAFSQEKVERTYIHEGVQEYKLALNGSEKPVQTYVKKGFKLSYYPAEEPVIKAWLSWNNVSLPIQKDQEVGRIQISNDKGEIIDSLPVLAKEAVSSTWKYRFLGYFENHKILFILAIFGLLATLVWLFRRKSY